MSSHQQTVQDQFDPRAQAYLTSAVHAQGPDLKQAQALVGEWAKARAGKTRALDVGTGGGHLSFALAPLLDRIVALDPSPQMLATVAKAAAERGLHQIAFQEGSAEALPFPDASFDLVVTRYSAHHWLELDRAMAEIRRVLAPGGALLVIDTEGDPSVLVDTHLQAIELLRDRSHVRNRSAAEWRALLGAAGFTVLSHQAWPLRLEFTSWIERMRTPADRAAIIRSLQQDAPQEVKDALAFEADGSFSIRTGLFWAR